MHKAYKKTSGRLFIKIYCKISPTVVKYFGDKKWFVGFFKAKLDRFVIKLKSNGFCDTPYDDINWKKE